MATKFAFLNFFKKDRQNKNELRLAIWKDGDDVPAFARGKLNFHHYSIKNLIENKDKLTILRLHNTEQYGDAIPIYGKLNTADNTLEVRLGKEKGKECQSIEEMSDKIVYEGMSLGFLAAALILMDGTTKNFEESQGIGTLGGEDSTKKESGKLDLAALAAQF